MTDSPWPVPKGSAEAKEIIARVQEQLRIEREAGKGKAKTIRVSTRCEHVSSGKRCHRNGRETRWGYRCERHMPKEKA